jgi:hypothetical protein
MPRCWTLRWERRVRMNSSTRFSPLDLLAFGWAIVVPIVIQPFWAILYAAVLKPPGPMTAVSRFVSGSFSVFHYFLYACAAGALLLFIWCARTELRDPSVVALGAVLVVSSVVLLMTVLLGFSVIFH